MEELLVDDAGEGEEPDGPAELHRPALQVAQLQPGCVAPCYKQVDHGPVTSVQQVSPTPETVFITKQKSLSAKTVYHPYPLLLTAATVWKRVETVKRPVRTAP